MRYQKNVIDPLVGIRDQFEMQLFTDQGRVEASALELYRIDAEKARSYLSDYSVRLAKDALGLMREMTVFAESH